MEMIAVVEIEVGREKLFEHSLCAHRAGEAIDGRIVRAAAYASCEVVFNGERLFAKLQIMQIDCKTVGVMTQPTAARTSIGVGA